MTEIRLANGTYHPDREAGAIHRRRLEATARKKGAHSLNLRYFGGRTFSAMTFVNLYVGGQAKWQASDIQSIDHALGATMSDEGLNNMLAQYFNGAAPTTTMLPSVVLTGAAPATVGKDTVEGWVTSMHADGQLPGNSLESTVYCFMLPESVVLTDGPAAGGAEEGADEDGAGKEAKLPGDNDEADSTNGLGGYHGSVHVGGDTVYYAVGVYSKGANGIDAFGTPWKNVVATFYHELNEARTDADVEDADMTPAGEKKLGWYSMNQQGGEIGDIPMNLAGADLSKIMVEVELADGSGPVPIQLMWSNHANGPEGPVPSPLPAAG
jgi:hypothetical protein